MRSLLKNLLILFLILGIVFLVSDLTSHQVKAGQTIKIRKEINILNGYKGGPSGQYATSSSLIRFDTANYTEGHYYFEIVASTTSAVSSNVYLKNTSTLETVATITFSNSNTYTLYRTEFTPTSGVNEYQVVLGNEAVQKGIRVARIVILQNATQLGNTSAQFEIGNRELDKSNTETEPLLYPKYWNYTAANWDGSPTFFAEVTYKSSQVSSTTVYTTSPTVTTEYTYIVSPGASETVIEAWGAGGGGQGGNTSQGGAGGGGGAYARSTTTLAVDSSHTLSVPAGGAADSPTAAGSATFDSTVVVAVGGTGTNNQNGGAGGTGSTGQATADGGTGGNGLGTNDTGGGGGGAAGPAGAGGDGADGQTSVGGGGGGGNGGDAATTQTGGSSTSGGAGGNGGDGAVAQVGTSNTEGGGGGGGSDTSQQGGEGGTPGGGGGGSDANVTNGNGRGGPGQIRLTEIIAGEVNVCLEEDGGGDFNFVCKYMIVDGGSSPNTSLRVRVPFTPTDGRNYRITASTTAGTYNLYNAKIIVHQTNPTKFEAQYLIANTVLSSGTALQKFLTKWDPQEWNTTNTYYHEANSVSGGTSAIKLQDVSGPTDITNSLLSNVVQRSRSSSLTMPVSAATIDAISTVNNGDLAVSRVIVLVTVPAAQSEGSASATRSFLKFVGGRMKSVGGRIMFR